MPAAVRAARTTKIDATTRTLGRRAIQRNRSRRLRPPPVMAVEQDRRSRGPGFAEISFSSVSP